MNGRLSSLFPQPRKTLAPILIYRPTHRHHMDLFISPNPAVKRLSRNNCSRLMSLDAFSPELHQISREGNVFLFCTYKPIMACKLPIHVLLTFKCSSEITLFFSSLSCDSTALFRTDRTSDITDRRDRTEVVRVAFHLFRCFILTLTQISLISFTLNQIL